MCSMFPYYSHVVTNCYPFATILPLFSELTCANIIIDRCDMRYKLTFHLFLFCKRIRTKYKASAHCRNGDEYGVFLMPKTG